MDVSNSIISLNGSECTYGRSDLVSFQNILGVVCACITRNKRDYDIKSRELRLSEEALYLTSDAISYEIHRKIKS